MEMARVLKPPMMPKSELHVSMYMHRNLPLMYMYCMYIVHVLMRDEKEGRKKQARSNKQQGKATQHTQGSRTCLGVLRCFNCLFV